MGAHKPLVRFGEGTLLDAVIARIAPQVERLAVDVPQALAKDYPYENVLPDLFAEARGPLCGIVTGLDWLDADLLATFPCDTPFLPRDLVAQLAQQGAPVTVKDMPVCGLWPKSARVALEKELHAHGSVRRALTALGGCEIDIAASKNAFFNVNSRAELEEAMRLSSPTDEASRPR